MLKYKKGRLISLFVILIIMPVTFLAACNDLDNKEDITTPKPAMGESSKEPHPPIPSENGEAENESYVNAGDLELPPNGATGYTSVSMELKTEAGEEATTIQILKPGTAFKITKENGDWWFIENETAFGWVKHKYCLINLPDVVPSIIYDNTNTYSAKYLSSGISIPGITGAALYEGKAFNERLGKSEYIMPVLYSTAKKINLAQQDALMDGNSLKIYEAYRPHSVQQAIVAGLSELAKNDSDVMKGISASPWSMNWFIATNISNHQRGSAIDVSLVKIDIKRKSAVGKYTYPEIISYTEYTMPTQIHELSIAAIAFTAPVSAKSPTAWKSATLAGSMNDAAIRLQKYCTTAGLTPLASEWWHFNDLDAVHETMHNSSSLGMYYLTECLSSLP